MVYNWASRPVIKAQVFLALMPKTLCQHMFIRAVKAHNSSCEKLMALSLIMTDRGCILRMIALVVLWNCGLWSMLTGWLRKGKQVVCSSFNAWDSVTQGNTVRFGDHLRIRPHAACDCKSTSSAKEARNAFCRLFVSFSAYKSCWGCRHVE